MTSPWDSGEQVLICLFEILVTPIHRQAREVKKKREIYTSLIHVNTLNRMNSLAQQQSCVSRCLPQPLGQMIFILSKHCSYEAWMYYSLLQSMEGTSSPGSRYHPRGNGDQYFCAIFIYSSTFILMPNKYIMIHVVKENDSPKALSQLKWQIRNETAGLSLPDLFHLLPLRNNFPLQF